MRHRREREYNRQRNGKGFYGTQAWKKAKKISIARYNGIDIYSLYILGVLEYGQTVHHVVPLEDAPDLSVEQSNLIYLTESNHQKIHKMMIKNKEKTIEMLREIMKRWDAGGKPETFL